MKKIKILGASALCGALLLIATTGKGADTKNYQVTGPILEVTPTMIAVMKGKDRWEVTRDQSTKVSGDLKVGAKVTIYYKMIATEVEAKEAKTKK